MIRVDNILALAQMRHATPHIYLWDVAHMCCAHPLENFFWWNFTLKFDSSFHSGAKRKKIVCKNNMIFAYQKIILQPVLVQKR